MDTANLKKKHRTWYVQLRVPAPLVDTVGMRLLTRTLKTHDIAEAVRLKHAVLAEFHNTLRIAETTKKLSNPINNLIAKGILLAQQSYTGMLLQDDAEQEWDGIHNAMQFSYIPDSEYGWFSSIVSDKERQILTGLNKAIVNKLMYTPLSDAIALYLDTDKDRLRPSTLQQRKTRLDAFKGWRGDCELNDITKGEAGKYVTGILEPRRLALATLKHTIGDLSSFFNWCCGRGMSENNPFDGVSRTVRSVKRGVRKTGDELRPWTEDELLKLITQTKPMSDLWSMSVLALYTGMRVNELAEAKCDDVHSTQPATSSPSLDAAGSATGAAGSEGNTYVIDIPEAKTSAGRRKVPVHPVIAPLVAYLLKTSTDGYLVSGLKPGGYDNKRNHMFVKRFSYHKRVKLKLPAALKFHGLRKNYATALRRAGVPVDRVEQLIGHSHGTLAQDVYIDGALLTQLIEDVQSVSHGETIDSMITTMLDRAPCGGCTRH